MTDQKNSGDNLTTCNSCMSTEWLHPVGWSSSALAFFTSRGVVDGFDGSYNGFNVCHYTGDSISHVSDCRRLLASRIGVGADRLVVPRQTHSTNVAVIKSFPVPSESIEGVDALVTSLRGVAIGVSTADCVPVLLSDDSAGVIGVVHAGWRGAVGGIVERTVETMLREGAAASGIVAALGPSICAKCFEVGEEVADQFPPECVVRNDTWPKPHVDLQRYICDKLMVCGLLAGNITPFSASMCTRCHPGIFFSARALGVNSGRVFSFVMQ